MYENKKENDKEYLIPFTPPQNLLEWLEDFVVQLDCPPPIQTKDMEEYLKRIGAWETQYLILKKLKYAINQEKLRLGEK